MVLTGPSLYLLHPHNVLGLCAGSDEIAQHMNLNGGGNWKCVPYESLMVDTFH